MQQIGYYLTSPTAIMQAIGSVLLGPALLILLLSLLWMAYQTGVVVYEFIRRRRARRNLDVNATAAELAPAIRGDNPKLAQQVLDRFRYGPVLPIVANGFLNGDYSRVHAAKLLTDAEQRAARRLEGTRVFSRVGPVLGLITTLIPISPALVGLSTGNIEALSANLVIAFSSTVVGLLVGGLGYLLSVARERMYAQDLSDLEYVLERAGV